MRLGGHVDAEGVFDGEAVGEGVADGGVAADPFGQFDAVGGVAAFEELLDAFVDEPEAGLHLQDGFADDGEPEVAGFDEPGVDRADGDLVDAGAFDGRGTGTDRRLRRTVGGGRRRGASGASRRASAGAGRAGAGMGWPSGSMPNRSRISRSNRPAGRTALARLGISGRSVGSRRTSSHRRSSPAANEDVRRLRNWSGPRGAAISASAVAVLRAAPRRRVSHVERGCIDDLGARARSVMAYQPARMRPRRAGSPAGRRRSRRQR